MVVVVVVNMDCRVSKISHLPYRLPLRTRRPFQTVQRSHILLKTRVYGKTLFIMTKTALILLDIQTNIVERVKNFIDIDQYLEKVSSTLAEARKAGILVVQVTTGFRPSYADASPRNPMTAHVKGSGLFKDTDASVQLHQAIVGAAADDIHVKKRRVSALYGNDLDIVLRSSGVDKIVVAGLATSGAVLSTVRQAFDMDYEITVLADLCADPQTDVHEILVKKVLSKQASVLNAAEWLASLGEGL
ncbi:Isochorismatase-like protein [Xylaria palmicola]|nr:Isochorismatase-like protein [Xylaria palmicola]